jgi:hypothetical protein
MDTLNDTDLVTSTKVISSDGTEQPATYHNENMIYKDFYDVSNLSPNTTYNIRMRVQNEFESEWSRWSRNITVTTHTDKKRVLIRHKSHHHDRKNRLFGEDIENKIFGNKAQKSVNAISLLSMIAVIIPIIRMI